MATAKLLQPNVGKAPAYPLAGAFESENVSGKVNIKESLETIKSSLIGGIKDAMKEVTTEIKNISPKKSDGKSISSSNSYESLINVMEDKLSSKFDFFKPITKAAKELRGESKDGKGSKEAKELLDIEKQQTNYTKALLKETTIIRLLVEKIAKVKYDPRAKGAQFRDDAGKFVKLGATGKELKPFGPSVSSAQTSIQQKTPAATEQKKVEQAAQQQQQQPTQEAESDSGLGLSDMLSTGWKGVKTAGKTIAKGALSLGKGAARFMGSTAGKVLGATAAVGMGAYTAYKGWTGAEEDKQAKLEEIDAAVKSGEITPQEAEAQKQQVADQTTEKKSGAVGEGTGMAAGAIAGAKLGATVGTFIGGPIGTGVGALAGGALGAVAGSTVGKKIGEYGGKAINAIGNFFSGGKEKAEEKQQSQVKIGPNWKERLSTYETGSTPVSHLEKQYPGVEKEFITLAKKTAPKSDSQMSIEAHERGLKALALKNVGEGKSSPSEVGSGVKETPKVEQAEGRSSSSIGNGLSTKSSNLRGEASRLGIDPNNAQGTFEGGVLTKITDRTTGREYPIEVPEADKRKVEAARTMRADNQRSGEIARTSRENAAMEREASRPIVTPIISNNNVQTNKQEIVPIKASPRSDSSFTRYMDRAAAW